MAEPRSSSFRVKQALAFTLIAVALVLASGYAGGSAASAQEAEVREFPADKELFARDVETNVASVPIAGTASAQTAEMILEVYREGLLIDSLNHQLDGSGEYAFIVEIPAELANDEFVLQAVDASGARSTIARASEVVAGDVFVING